MTVFKKSSKMKQPNSRFITTPCTRHDVHVTHDAHAHDTREAHVTRDFMKICVDGSVTGGNPGVAEYRGVDLYTKSEIFRIKLNVPATNNIVEWLAICEAAKFLIGKPKKKCRIYSDSMIAINWYNQRTVKTNMAEKYPAKWTDELSGIIAENLIFIRENSTHLVEVRFWNKRTEGEENPADFGRK